MIKKNTQDSLLSLLPRFSIQESSLSFLTNENNVQKAILFLCAILYQNEENNKLYAYNELFQLINKNFQETPNSFLLAHFHYLLLQKNIPLFETIKQISTQQDKEFFLSILDHLIKNPFFNTKQNNQLFTEIYQYIEKENKKLFSLPVITQIKKSLETQTKNLTTQLQKTFPKRNIQNEEQLKNPAYILQNKLYTLFSQLEEDKNIQKHKDIFEEIENFKTTLAVQDYHIVIVGEGKRGKSSLLNALLEEEISQVEESIPQTAVPLEFYYQENPTYFVEFLDEFDKKKQQELLPQYSSTNIHNINYQKKVKIQKHEIADYAFVTGKFVMQTAKMYIGLKHTLLKQGFHISDTPGLNSLNPFHDYLTYKESLKADCIIFVMDARKPDSASELEFLEKISQQSRAVNIIGLLSGVDRLNKTENLSLALNRAKILLEKATEKNKYIKICSIIPLNPKELMEHFCHKKALSKTTQKNWQNLLNEITKAITSHQNKTQYQEKIENNAQYLLKKIIQQIEQNDLLTQNIFPHNIAYILKNHENNLIEATQKYAEQAQRIILSVEKDIEAWKQQQQNDLEQFEELFVNEIQIKMQEYADNLGVNVAKADKWQEFDQNIAKKIAEKNVTQFIKTQEQQLQTWEHKITIFEKQLHDISNDCLKTIAKNIHSLGDTSINNTTINHILIQGNIKVKQISLFLAGAGSGIALSASFFNIVTVGSIALAFLGDPISISGLVLTGLGALTLHFKGNLQKHKQSILEKKYKKTKNWANTIKKALEEILQEKQNELIEQYKEVIKQGFVPSFELLMQECIHIHWYTEFMLELQKNTDKKEENTKAKLHNALLMLEAYKNL